MAKGSFGFGGRGVSRRFYGSVLVCFLFLPPALRADALSPPQAADWRQKVENSLSGGNYQPVLDGLRNAALSPHAQEYQALARQVYAEILSAQPASNNAFYAGKGLLFMQIVLKDPAADTTLASLKSAFSAHPGLVTTLREAADVYFYWAHDPSRAKVLYQQILEDQPSGPEAIWAQRGLVMTALETGDYAAAETAAETLLSNYSNHPQINTAVRIIADRFFFANDISTAHRFYQWIKEHEPAGESIWVQRGLVMTNLRLAEYAAAEEALDGLQAEYSAHPLFALALREAADEYFYWGNDPDKARTLYQRILRDCPGGTESIWAQRGLVLAALEIGDKKAADRQTEILLSGYSDHPQIATAVRVVADQYFYVGQDPAAAAVLYQRILKDWPNGPEAMAAQRGLAMAKINLGDSVSGNAAADKLLSEFTGQTDLDIKTAEVIQQYCRAGRTADVIALSEKILSQNPTRPMALTAQTALAQAYVQMGQGDKAGEYVKWILENCRQEKRVGYSLFVIGEEYFLRGEELISQGGREEGRQNLSRAIEIWESVRTQSADSLHQAHAFYYSAAAYHKIGRYEDALACYQHLVDQWPGYEKAWYAQFMIAQCSEELARQNKLPLESANAAYQRVIDKYPDSSAAKLAAKKIRQL
jgi:outer membrane protein assembly factor BamD (BamD/ComL family)